MQDNQKDNDRLHLRGMSVKYKLYLSLIIINILALSIGFTSWSAFRSSGHTMRLVTEEMIPVMDSVSEVIVLSARLSTLAPRLIFVQTNEELEITYQELSSILVSKRKIIERIKRIKNDETDHQHAEFSGIVREVENSSVEMARRLEFFKDGISILIESNRRQEENAKILSVAHSDFITGTSPVSDDAQFELIIGLEDQDALKGTLSKQAETLALALEIKSEGNLLAGILETAMHYEELEGIVPLQERFEATLSRLETYLSAIIDQSRDEFVLINSSVQVMSELGKNKNNVFFLQKERLRKYKMLQADLKSIEEISYKINASVNKLAMHTKSDVAKTKEQADNILRAGNYTIVIVSCLSLFFTFMLSWFYIRDRVIGRIEKLKSVMLALADKRYDMPIEGEKGGDEIGQMANALAIFREKLIENDVLTRDLQKTTEEAEEAKNKMFAILDATGDGIYALDVNGHTTTANAAAEKMLGFSLEEMLGKSQHALIHHSYPDGSKYPVENCNIYKAIRDGKTTYVEDEVFWRKDKTSFPVSYHSTPIIDETGHIKGAVVSFQDITERKEKERALRHAKREAEHANQAKSEFLANMSHELRTPLNSIIGMSQILIEDMSPGEEQEMVGTVNRSATNLLDIVNDILDLSKIEAKQMVLENIGFDFKETMASIVETMAPIASKKGVWLNYKYEQKGLPLIKGDPVRLGRILTNLIGNAVKYTIQGGVEVIIDFKYLNKKENQIELVCSIIDTGIGIPKDKLEEIFKKFTQADESTTRKFGGTGLGLAITKELVTMMGGEIGVDSIEGNGSTFWFKVPFHTTKTLHSETREAHRDNTDIRKQYDSSDKISVDAARILVAEDHELNQAFIKKLLKRMGFQDFDLVSSGLKALEAYKAKNYDLILMDCHMPEMNGYQATEEIRIFEQAENRLCVPIIALTADAMVGTRERCLQKGMDGYVSKPLDASILKSVISQWIALPDDFVRGKQALSQESELVMDLSIIKAYADTDEEMHAYCTVFFSQTEEAISKLKKQCIDGESMEWSEISHKIKGGAGMMGATALQKLADEAQEMKEATKEERQETLSKILKAYEAVKKKLESEIFIKSDARS